MKEPLKELLKEHLSARSRLPLHLHALEARALDGIGEEVVAGKAGGGLRLYRVSIYTLARQAWLTASLYRV